MIRAAAPVLALLALAAPAALPAQQAPATPPVASEGGVRSPVLTIDPELLYSGSAFGDRIARELQAETEALAAENRRITAELEAEETSLTERRPTMAPEAFRAEAAAFDEKVQEIRRTQDAKERALNQTVQQAQEQFLAAARPVLGRLMAEYGAAVILDRRTVILGVGAIDITDEAVARIDAEIGDGTGDGDVAPEAQE
ncbi:hypothetical protein OG2516_01999 [Oceanicola granulosus HTCC2516]|uniref:Uncharacterized protein n=1 Tax=Oceanicola granulosus (strain ATCC BAA-861 / DSM 15982 / KCTC 12143 / HTCC2516) TaxID=314256 RepID=Q2CHX4_OCEGH|nr:OmpH family outer membrane protein [Oceanicola granulosus]EAR52170.1 hypothetical protein OG2516_01999 [Oceanicola granulosus HTCC2516]